MKAPNYQHYLDLETGKAIDQLVKTEEGLDFIDFELVNMIRTTVGIFSVGALLGSLRLVNFRR
jgi:hypothetical protein